MKNANKLILGAIVLLLSAGITLSSAFANTPAIATDAATEAVKQSTGDVAKKAATDLVDSTKEKAIGMAKEHATKAVDSGMAKATEALTPATKAVDAVQGATK